MRVRSWREREEGKKGTGEREKTKKERIEKKDPSREFIAEPPGTRGACSLRLATRTLNVGGTAGAPPGCFSPAYLTYVPATFSFFSPSRHTTRPPRLLLLFATPSRPVHSSITIWLLDPLSSCLIFLFSSSFGSSSFLSSRLGIICRCARARVVRRYGRAEPRSPLPFHLRLKMQD